MKKHHVLFVLLILALVAVPAAVPGNAFAKAKVLRLVVPVPPNDYPLAYSLGEMAKKFNERAKGEYEIEIFAGGALAKMPEYFDAVRVGAVEMASVGWTIFSFLDPRLGAIEEPYLFNNNDAANYAVKDILPLYDEILQKKFNAKGLGLHAFTASELLSTKPIKSLEDIKGMMIGSISPMGSIMAKDLGASPVTIMWTDMYESLQKNVVDATIFNIHAGKVMSIYDACKYATLFFGLASYQGLSINLDVYKKMPAHIKTILHEESDASNQWVGKIFGEMVEQEIKDYTKDGIQFYTLPPTERERWVKATIATRDEHFQKYGEFGAKIKAIADEANKKFPYQAR